MGQQLIACLHEFGMHYINIRGKVNNPNILGLQWKFKG